MPGQAENNLAPWRRSLNPAIYLVSILPAVGVVLLANPGFWWQGLVIATLAVILLQHAINLFNDVSDWHLGADTEKADSWVLAYAGDTRRIQRYALLSMLLGSVLGLLTLYWSSRYWILLFAAPLLLLGYCYNAGSKPLSYTVLGEWVTGLCYGPGVFGGLYLLTGNTLDPVGVLGMLTFATLAMALLLSHQPPQIRTDKQAGKYSFAVRYGEQITVRTTRILLLFVVSTFFFALWLSGQTLLAGAFMLLAALALQLNFRKPPNPKVLLLSSSMVFAGTLLLERMLYCTEL